MNTETQEKLSPEELTDQRDRLDKLQKSLDDRSDSLQKQQNSIKRMKNLRILRAVLGILLTAAFIIICTFSLYRRLDEEQIFEKPVPVDEWANPISPGETGESTEPPQVPTDADGNPLPITPSGYYLTEDEDGNPLLVEADGTPLPKTPDGEYFIGEDEDGNPILIDKTGTPLPRTPDGYFYTKDKLGNPIIIDINGNPVNIDIDGVPETTEPTEDGSGHFTIYSNGDVYTAENGAGVLHCDVRNTEDSTHDIVMSLYISAEELQAHGLSTAGVEDGQWLIAQTGLFEPGYQISEVQLNTLPDGSYLPAGSYSLTMNERYYHHKTGVLSSYEANIPVTLEVAN